MKSLASIASLCCALLVGMAPPAEKAEKIDRPNPKPHALEPLETVQKRLKEEKAVIYDVREKREWKAGHLAQAELLPLTELGKKLREPEYVAGLKKNFPADKPIYLHCKSGGRCVLAAEALREELGLEYDFRPLKPGYEELVKAGFPDAELKQGK